MQIVCVIINEIFKIKAGDAQLTRIAFFKVSASCLKASNSFIFSPVTERESLSLVIFQNEWARGRKSSSSLIIKWRSKSLFPWDSVDIIIIKKCLFVCQKHYLNSILIKVVDERRKLCVRETRWWQNYREKERERQACKWQ